MICLPSPALPWVLFSFLPPRPAGPSPGLIFPRAGPAWSLGSGPWGGSDSVHRLRWAPCWWLSPTFRPFVLTAAPRGRGCCLHDSPSQCRAGLHVSSRPEREGALSISSGRPLSAPPRGAACTRRVRPAADSSLIAFSPKVIGYKLPERQEL